MELIKRIGHWLLYILGSFIGVGIIMNICYYFPVLIFIWIIKWNSLFLFLFVGTIAISGYYWLCIMLGMFFVKINSQLSPNHIAAKIIAALYSLFFSTLFAIFFIRFIEKFDAVFSSFRGIIFVISIFPSYLGVAIYSLFAPFIKDND